MEPAMYYPVFTACLAHILLGDRTIIDNSTTYNLSSARTFWIVAVSLANKSLTALSLTPIHCPHPLHFLIALCGMQNESFSLRKWLSYGKRWVDLSQSAEKIESS